MLPRHRLVDEDDVQWLAHFTIGEEAAADEPDIHRSEIPVVGHADIDGRLLARARRRLADDGEPGRRAQPGERQHADLARGLDARQRTDTADGVLEEPHALRRVRILRIGQCDADREDVVGREAWIDAAHDREGPEHQAGADEQHDRQRDFRHDEGVTGVAGFSRPSRLAARPPSAIPEHRCATSRMPARTRKSSRSGSAPSP
jgi:hypothetical protein